MSSEYHLMTKESKISPWTYIRKICPAMCTIHAIPLAPKDLIFTSILNFIHTHCTLSPNVRCTMREFCKECSHYTANMKMLQRGNADIRRWAQELRDEAAITEKLLLGGKEDSDKGYYNIVKAIIQYRLDLVVQDDTMIIGMRTPDSIQPPVHAVPVSLLISIQMQLAFHMIFTSNFDVVCSYIIKAPIPTLKKFAPYGMSITSSTIARTTPADSEYAQIKYPKSAHKQSPTIFTILSPS